MKIMDSKSKEVELETNISRAIRKIDPQNKYFIPLSGNRCIVNDIKYINELKKCLPYNKSTKKKDFRGFFIKYGGPDLYTYNNKIHKLNIYSTWSFLIHLIEGLNVLYQNKILHLDIKAGNILISNDNLPKIIDFGLSHYTKDYTYKSLRYYQIYPYWISMFYIESQNIYLRDYANTLKIYKKYYDYVFKKNYDIKKAMNERIIKYYNFILDNPEKKYDDYIKPYTYKIDIYMLALMFIHYLNIKFGDFYLQNKLLTNQLLILLVNCLNPNFKVQYGPKDAIDFIKNNNIKNIIRMKDISIHI